MKNQDRLLKNLEEMPQIPLVAIDPKNLYPILIQLYRIHYRQRTMERFINQIDQVVMYLMQAKKEDFEEILGKFILEFFNDSQMTHAMKKFFQMEHMDNRLNPSNN